MKSSYRGVVKVLLGVVLMAISLASFSVVEPVAKVGGWQKAGYVNCAGNTKFIGKCPEGQEIVIPSQFEYSILFDSFEYETIPVFRTPYLETGQEPPWGDKWKNAQVDSSDVNSTRPNNVFTTNLVSLYGDRSIQVERLAGGTSDREFQLMFYNNHGSVSNDWWYVKENVVGWVDNKVNRVRFWMLAPPEMSNNYINGQVSEVGAGDSLHFATFIRNSQQTRTDNESDNGHYYHYFDPKHEGNLWHQFIVDPHPSHQRGVSGSFEEGIITEPFPTTDPGKNYFDMMTYFYFDHKSTDSGTPANYYFDGIEFYEEKRDEDILNIYNPYMVYNDVTDEIVISWRRPKNDPDVTFDLKYATESFYDNGGFSAHGAPMPNGTAINNGRGLNPDGYNMVNYRGQIDVSGLDYIYVAIKASTEATKFREFLIPLTSDGYPVIGGDE